MVKITWKNEQVPQNMPIRQAYGIVFAKDGRMLVRIETKKDGRKVYCLTGGTPEDYDESLEATLRREFVEEADILLGKKIFYVGYQQIEGDGDRPTYAQVRYTALIDQINAITPDPATGETYERMLTTPQKAIELLGWGEVGKNQIERAYQIAQKEFGIGNLDQDELV